MRMRSTAIGPKCPWKEGAAVDRLEAAVRYGVLLKGDGRPRHQLEVGRKPLLDGVAQRVVGSERLA